MIADEDWPTCMVCSQRFQSVGRHVRRAHGMSPDEYRDRFGIRRGVSLSGAASRARVGERMRRTIASGSLAPHYAGNAARALTAGLAGVAARETLRAGGTQMQLGNPHPRATIADVVSTIEAGAKVSTAVKRAGISYSACHARLNRHPDLKARHYAARPSAASDRRGETTAHSQS